MRINVLSEILTWSLGRPHWQRDALRRLITKGELDQLEINELANFCKSRHGLVDRTNPVPLNASHLPQPDAGKKPVSLKSLTHHIGVNALAQDQTIEFGPQLTVVYGANAAGKSGYARILKRACRARGAEEVLGNVVSGAVPGRPSATIRLLVDDEPYNHDWDDNQLPSRHLSRVSVFDHRCASVYVTERTDVAFRPMGLDLFDKLSDCSEAVRRILEKERNSLGSSRLQFPEVVEGTTVHELLTDLTSLTNPESVKDLAGLTDVQKEHSDELRKRIRDLESDDPEKIARSIELRANRTELLVERVKTVHDALSDVSISELFVARNRMNEAQRVVEQLHRNTFHELPLPNTGSVAWKTLWDAAEQFSTADAYPTRDFPFTEEEARCVLCQQQLTEEGAQRFQQFQIFLNSKLQSEHDSTAASYRARCSIISDALIMDESAREALEELHLDNHELSEAVRVSLDTAESQRRRLCEALSGGSPQPEISPIRFLNVDTLTNYVDNLRGRVQKLREPHQPEAIIVLRKKLNELEARRWLGNHLRDVLDEIERKKKIAAYQVCIEETRTNAITRKSSEVTRRAVTVQLTNGFAKELDSLRFRHVEVELVDAGGSRGVLYHKLQLRRAPGVEVLKVVSEGEARCLSIASFFAELSTAADRSAILFDDPVSSLDHNWRSHVAKRLVVEAQSRQVIVFTHDIVFLLTLVEKAEKLGVVLKNQYLHRNPTVAGLSSQKLPWAAMKVTDRIGHLKDLWQDAAATNRKGQQQKYEMKASYIYGLLREAWERGLEEVLLGGTVERYRNSIQTRQISQLADINSTDCGALESGMTKCSKWLPGHDQAAADNEPFPEPSDLQADIKTLEDWTQRIRKRRVN